MQMNKREYSRNSETERDNYKAEVIKKDHGYYNRPENAWNNLHNLGPEMMKYSSHNVDPN